MEPPPKAGGAFPQGFVGFRVPFWGSYRGRYMGIMEMKMETTIMNHIGFRVCRL